MDNFLQKVKSLANSSIWFKGHSQVEDKKPEKFLIYPFTRAVFVLYGLAHKINEYDMQHWRHFARLNLLFIFYDINKRYSQMEERTSNEFKLKYGFDFLFWSILASHYIPYRFIQFFTYKYFSFFNKKFLGSRMLYIGYLPIVILSYFAYPSFLKVGDKISDLIMNFSYRIFVANYLNCNRFITF